MEFYGATEGASGMQNGRGRVGAVGFVNPVAAYLGRNIIKVDPETCGQSRDSIFGTDLAPMLPSLLTSVEPERDPATGLCVTCGPGEPGELVSRILKEDRGGPENFKVSIVGEHQPI